MKTPIVYFAFAVGIALIAYGVKGLLTEQERDYPEDYLNYCN